MSVKVAINGFGRIGRLAFRQMFGAEGYDIVAINDLTSPSMLAHLLKYDSAQKRYEKADTVVAGEDSITVDGKTIKIYAEKDAADLPWGELDVDVVLECTGFYTTKEKAEAHIKAGAKKVVISAPAGKDLPTVVFGVNENILTADEKIMKNGTAYITDIGMTGPIESVIGMDKDASIKRFVTSLPERYKIAEKDCKDADNPQFKEE